MKKNKKALSLVEILVAMVILTIAAAGLFSSFVAANKFISRSKRRLAAVNAARHINEELYKYVRANDWNDPADTNLLYCPGATYGCDKPFDLLDFLTLELDNPLNGFAPTVNLHIELVCDPGNPAQVSNPETECPRSVEITIQWDE